MKKDLIEVLTLLDSIGALQLVKRYGRRTQAALVAWLCERCRFTWNAWKLRSLGD